MRNMSRRYLLLEINESEYDLLRKNITNYSLNSQRHHGFVLSHTSENSIEGSHVNRETRTEEVTLPNGEKITYERPIVDIVRFKISLKSKGILELTNPPRKTSIFIRDLELASKFNIAFKSIDIDLHNFHKKFMEEFDDAESHFIVIKSTSISEQTYASIKIESEKSAYIEGDKFFNLSNKTIDKIGFKVGKDRLEVSRNGSISGTREFIVDNEDLIESMITKAKNTN